jgi:hypothetical protein
MVLDWLGVESRNDSMTTYDRVLATCNALAFRVFREVLIDLLLPLVQRHPALNTELQLKQPEVSSGLLQ